MATIERKLLRQGRNNQSTLLLLVGLAALVSVLVLVSNHLFLSEGEQLKKRVNLLENQNKELQAADHSTKGFVDSFWACRDPAQKDSRLCIELLRQENRGLDPSVQQLPGHVKNNLLRAQATGNDVYFEAAERHMDAHWNRCIAPNLPDLDASYVLEIAPGHGRNTNKLNEKFSPKKLIGVDINREKTVFLANRFASVPLFSFLTTSGVVLPAEVTPGVTFVYCIVGTPWSILIKKSVRGDPNNPHQRNANSKEYVEQKTLEAGLEVISRVDVVWDKNFGETDAITTFRKKR